MVEEDEAAVQAAGGELGAKTLIGLPPVRAAQRRLELVREGGEVQCHPRLVGVRPRGPVPEIVSKQLPGLLDDIRRRLIITSDGNRGSAVSVFTLVLVASSPSSVLHTASLLETELRSGFLRGRTSPWQTE